MRSAKSLFCIYYIQWCIAKNRGGYTQRGVAKGLKVPCLFMIAEVSIRCQKNPEVGIRRLPAYTPQYTTGFRQTVHTHRAPVHQAAKLVAALLRVARVNAGLAESNGSLPPGLWLTSPAGWLPRTGISARQLSLGYLYLLPTQPPSTVLRPLYRPTCISRHLQLRTGRLCWCSVSAHIPLVTATSTFRLWRRCWSSPQQFYLHCLCDLFISK